MKTRHDLSSRLTRIIIVIVGMMSLPVAGEAQELQQSNTPIDSAVSPTGVPNITWDSESGQAVLTSGRLGLVIETQGGINARSLRDLVTGRIYADRDYCWSNGAFPKLVGQPVLTKSPDGSCSVSLNGNLGILAIEQKFTASSHDRDAIIEEITITNPTTEPMSTADFKCGFAKYLRNGEAWTPDAGLRLCHVPYRRWLNGGMQDFPLREVAERGMSYPAGFGASHCTLAWGAEGWLWTDGTTTLLMSKYNPDGMEWSLLEPHQRGAETVVRFGGAGLWRPGLPFRPQDQSPPECQHGLPDAAANLGPGKSYTFGPTRLQVLDGDWKPAYYAFRKYTESLGCHPAKDYNPPVHWNELYDNKYYSKITPIATYDVDQDELRARMRKLMDEFYTLDDMKGEAAKAKELGCEALYMDPGWDFPGCSFLWDAPRLGSFESFIKLMGEQYGLKVSLWCGLGGVPPTWADPASCPVEAQVMTKDGKRNLVLCFSNPAFLDARAKNLLALARKGVAFFMFDSTQYPGPCYDTAHGHKIPSARDEHADSIYELARRIKQECPDVLIESHDPITGPGAGNYAPTYLNFVRPHSFDCIWGHEFMWNSMDDLISGRAVSLYYYNLAYSIPIYLHVGLNSDNANALVFWWYASICRHLGVGGKHPDPTVWEAQKKAMQTYLPLKRFYTQGEFYGIDEMVHVHTLPDLGRSVINAFNIDEKPVQRQVSFRLAEIGLPSGPVQIEGSSFRQSGDEVVLDLAIPARGHLLLKVQAAADLPRRNQSEQTH